MKKRLWILIVLVLLMELLASAAQASFEGEYAHANQKLSFRTGPNTSYVEMFTMPQSTHVEVISKELGNDVIWVLCSFEYNGDIYYGYTGLKRFDLSPDMLPWSDFSYWGMYALYDDIDIYSAPYGEGIRCGKLIPNEMVNVLGMDGDYAFIEFYDAENEAPSRGWVDYNNLGYSGYLAEIVLKACNVYEEPSSDSDIVGKVGKYEVVAYINTNNGYDEILFYSASKKELMHGYVEAENVQPTI